MPHLTAFLQAQLVKIKRTNKGKVVAILSIQIQSGWKDPVVLSSLMIINSDITIKKFTIERGNNNGPFVNLLIKCRSGLRSWCRLRTKLNKIAHFRSNSIIICTGARGWKDYVLLQHYNESTDLQQIRVRTRKRG